MYRIGPCPEQDPKRDDRTDHLCQALALDDHGIGRVDDQDVEDKPADDEPDLCELRPTKPPRRRKDSENSEGIGSLSLDPITTPSDPLARSLRGNAFALRHLGASGLECAASNWMDLGDLGAPANQRPGLLRGTASAGAAGSGAR